METSNLCVRRGCMYLVCHVLSGVVRHTGLEKLCVQRAQVAAKMVLFVQLVCVVAVNNLGSGRSAVGNYNFSC